MRPTWVRWRLVVCSVVVVGFVVAFLPCFIPGRGGDEVWVPGSVERVCQVLYFIDTLFVPSGTPDSVRMPVNFANCALWGLAVGLLLSLAFPRKDRGSAP